MRRVVLVVEYEVVDNPSGVLEPVVERMRQDGYLDDVNLRPGVRLVSLHGAIEGSAARVMAVFEQDEVDG